MTPEEQKAADAAKVAADAKAEDDKADAGPAEDASEKGKTEDEDGKNVEIDYEAELELERNKRIEEEKKRKKAEVALAEKRFKSKNKPPEKAEDDEEVDDILGIEDEEETEEPITESRLEERLARERAENQKLIQAARAEEIAKSITGSEAEKNLTLEIHKNRSWPTYMPLAEQLEEAHLLANKKKIKGTIAELGRAAKGKAGVVDTAATSHQAPPDPGKKPQMAPQDAAEHTRLGYTWNNSTKRLEKNTANGGLIYIDSKTKKTVFVPRKG